MLNAIKLGKNAFLGNTKVEANENGVFVVLYDTIIFAKVRGWVYYSDGGHNTRTTSSRLKALGADGIQETGHIRHEANNFEHKECEEKPHKGQTGHSDGKITLHPTVVPLVARKRNTGRFWPLFGRVGAMEATAARRVRAKVLRRRAPTFVAGRGRPPPYYAHNEGRMNSFRFYNNFKISKE